jgi:arginine exporter protein ArgO
VLEALLSGLVAGYGIAIPVGAIAVLVISLTARTSLVVGTSAALGVASADGLYALAAVLGGAALARLTSPVAVPLRWLAAAVLVALAGRIAYSAWRRYRQPDGTQRAGAGLGTPGRAYGGLLSLTLLNPATVSYFAALVIGRQASAPLSGAGAALFVLGAFVASASWQLLVAAGGSVLGRVLTGPRGRLATAIVSSAVIAVLALRLLAGQ